MVQYSEIIESNTKLEYWLAIAKGRRKKMVKLGEKNPPPPL